MLTLEVPPELPLSSHLPKRGAGLAGAEGAVGHQELSAERTQWLRPCVTHHKRHQEAVKTPAPLGKLLSTSGQWFTPESQTCPCPRAPLTFCTCEINTPLLKPGSGASDSAKLFLLPALLATAGAVSRLCVSNCWLEEGHLPFRMAWQMLSMRLMITRSCKQNWMVPGWDSND